MVTELQRLFTALDHYVELELGELERKRGLHAVYASPEQVYVVAAFSSTEEFIARWEAVAEAVAVTVQSQLTEELSDLRWDMYLLYVIADSTVPAALRKQVENNRRFCRKLVLTPAEQPFSARLPLFLQLPAAAEGVLFDETDFWREWQAALPEEVKAQFGDSFWRQGEKQVEDVVQQLIGGMSNADPSA